MYPHGTAYVYRPLPGAGTQRSAVGGTRSTVINTRLLIVFYKNYQQVHVPISPPFLYSNSNPPVCPTNHLSL